MTSELIQVLESEGGMNSTPFVQEDQDCTRAPLDKS
jgi:hypothetical protein